MKFLSILERAKVFAEEAGRKALEMQKHLESIRFKNPKDVVTSADLESERIIISHLKEEFPDH